ncbi:MAG: elongation factor P [Nitrospirae bacterium]|nr:elongation factor P [Nitrospirota bacterium]
MISTTEFKKGAKIEYNGNPYEILDFQHVKMQQRSPIVRTKIKNLKTRQVLEETFKAGDKFDTPDLEEKNMQYLYGQGDTYFFMDTENYEQLSLSSEQLSDSKKFLKENMEVKILYYRGSPLTVQVPMFVELKIVETAPGIRGDTAAGGSKSATIETGAVIKVPFHLNKGDVIKIDTRTSEYIERVR